MPGQIIRPDRIETAIARLRSTANLLQAALDGQSSLNSIAADLGITAQKLNQQLAKEFRPWIRTKMIELTDLYDLIENLRTPGDRLIFAMLDLTEKAQDRDMVILLPSYDEDKFWEAVEGVLKEREYGIIAQRFGHKCPAQTMAEIASDCGLPRSYVSMLYGRILFKLRHSGVLKTVFSYDELDACIAAQELLPLTDSSVKSLLELRFSGQMSTLACNACTRAGYETAEDLLQASKSEISSIRGVGVKTAEEIQALVRKLREEKAANEGKGD